MLYSCVPAQPWKTQRAYLGQFLHSLCTLDGLTRYRRCALLLTAGLSLFSGLLRWLLHLATLLSALLLLLLQLRTTIPILPGLSTVCPIAAARYLACSVNLCQEVALLGAGLL